MFNNLFPKSLIRSAVIIISCVLIVFLGTIFLDYSVPDTAATEETVSADSSVADANYICDGTNNEGTCEPNTVRTATLVIAASNSSAASKTQADYVCDGIDDQIEINAAMNSLPANGGEVVLLEGTYYISGSITMAPSSWLTGQGPYNTTIQLADNANCHAIVAPTSNSWIRGIRDLRLEGNYPKQTGVWHGIYSKTSQVNDGDLRVLNCSIFHFSGDGIHLANGYYIHIKDSAIEYNVGNGIFLSSGMAVLDSLDLHDNYRNLRMEYNAQTTIINSHLRTTVSDNIYAQQYENLRIINNMIERSGDLGVSGFGIYLRGLSSGSNKKVIILGNIFLGGPKESYNVYINQSNEGILISDNNFSGYRIGAIYRHSSAKDVKINNNHGYATENSGIAAIKNGATKVVVKHGLATVPTQISLTPTNGMGNATKFYVDSLTTTDFTINVDADPGEKTATFNWRAVAE